ncbi:MAG: radical SAM family heme chaperone HemW [Puia sp.]|nr:radical SAM family heme chaperone HemW [Puia sp.]
MAGIYLHIPFCKQACHYCNFHFSTSLHRKNDFVTALLKEIELRKKYIGTESIETIYFGGGTPSLLEDTELVSVMEKLRSVFRVEDHAEITLEANPDDIREEKLESWRDSGINRLSIGVQSFFAEDLRWMNRAHDAAQALDSIRLAQEQGFSNISIDLIYGTPGLSDSRWKENVSRALSLDIPHLSCYALTVEPKTALDKMIRMKKAGMTNPDDQARQFLLLMDWLDRAGYEHYEISNFARPGKRSRHNSAYWQGKKYLGLGPSAHSYNGPSREWNASHNGQYIEAVMKGLVLAEKEELTTVQRLNEYIMISLRTKEGCELERVSEIFGVDAGAALRKKAAPYLETGNLECSGSRPTLILSREGRLLADGIAAALFFEENELPEGPLFRS